MQVCGERQILTVLLDEKPKVMPFPQSVERNLGYKGEVTPLSRTDRKFAARSGKRALEIYAK